MKRRHVLAAGFALGALAALAVVAAATWTAALHPAVTGLSVSGSASPSPEVTPSPLGKPVERAGAVMAYDPENHGVIMFGGATFAQTADGSNSVSLGDTWLWNGKSWRQLNVSGPSPRSASVAAYDSVRHVIVLFGGSGPGGAGPATFPSRRRRSVSAPTAPARLRAGPGA